MIRTCKFRLRPTRAQHRALERILEDQRQLYNAALEERIGAWRKARKSINYLAQQRSVTECRAALPDMTAIPVNIQRGTLRRLERSVARYFQQRKTQKAGFPRFKPREDFLSFEFANWHGIRFDGKRLRFKGMPGGLRLSLHRSLPPGTPLAATFCRDVSGWSVSLPYSVEPSHVVSVVETVGLDVGLTHFATLSTGQKIENIRPARNAHTATRRLQRSLERKAYKSRNWRKAKGKLARRQSKVRRVRRTFHMQKAAELVKQFALVAVEAINIKGLSRGVCAKDVNDAGWGSFLRILRDKAEMSGCTVVSVDPAHTSQTCPDCGRIEPKTIKQRVHSCACGCVMDRDVAAAKVILQRAVMGPRVLNVADSSERRRKSLGGAETSPETANAVQTTYSSTAAAMSGMRSGGSCPPA